MFDGCIGVRTDVLTTEDITADILATTGEDIIDRTILALIGGMCGEFIDVRTGEVITDARRVAPFPRGFFFMGDGGDAGARVIKGSYYPAFFARALERPAFFGAR